MGTPAVRIGLEFADVVTDWGLRRLGLEAVRDAVTLLLSREVCLCLASVRAAQSAAAGTAREGLQPVLHTASGLTAEGVATAWGLSVREKAALIELRWAALAESRAERIAHLDHAERRLTDWIAAGLTGTRTMQIIGDDIDAPAGGERRLLAPANGPIGPNGPTDGDAA